MIAHGYVSGTVSLTKGLFNAIEDGKIDEVKRVINDGADVNAENSEGKTAIMWAVEKGLAIKIL